jgi:hypothetical protein
VGVRFAVSRLRRCRDASQARQQRVSITRVLNIYVQLHIEHGGVPYGLCLDELHYRLLSRWRSSAPRHVFLTNTLIGSRLDAKGITLSDYPVAALASADLTAKFCPAYLFMLCMYSCTPAGQHIHVRSQCCSSKYELHLAEFSNRTHAHGRGRRTVTRGCCSYQESRLPNQPAKMHWNEPARTSSKVSGSRHIIQDLQTAWGAGRQHLTAAKNLTSAICCAGQETVGGATR